VDTVKSQLLEWLREWWKPAAVLFVTACLLFFMSAANSRTEKRLEQVALETHTALCTFVADLQTRHDVGQEFLKKHPQGIEGISRADIRRSLEAQRATLRALSVLRCGEEK